MKALWMLTIGASLGLLQACAYSRPPEVTAQMARTEAVLQQAERSGAQESALPEFQSARNKFAEAQRAYERQSKEGDQKALQLARQAEVDAQYASAKSQTARQQAAAREVEQGVDALLDEARRNTVAPAADPD